MDACCLWRGDGLSRLSDEPGCRSIQSHAHGLDRQLDRRTCWIWPGTRLPGNYRRHRRRPDGTLTWSDLPANGAQSGRSDYCAWARGYNRFPADLSRQVSGDVEAVMSLASMSQQKA